ncbi:MAG TPA: hypothetical protein VGJ73_12920 [Verrucomicrobiae bacterium]|jgi:hypothetical protein
MQVEMFILCDRFVIAKSPQGKTVWSIIEPFDSIDLPEFPSRISFSLAAAVRFFAEEHGNHNIRIRLLDADLKQLIEPATKKPIELNKQVNVPDENRAHCKIEIWFAGQSGKIAGPSGVWIEKPGDYFFELNVDGKNVAQVPLHILLVR